MGSADSMRQVMDIVVDSQKDSHVAAVVVSAMSGTTDLLIKVAHLAAAQDISYKQIMRDLKKRHVETAQSLSCGEEVVTVITDTFTHLESVLQGISLVRELSLGALDHVMSYGEQLSARMLASAFTARGSTCSYLDARAVVTTDDSFGSATVDFKKTNANIKAHFKEHPELHVVTGFIGSTSDQKTTTLGRGGSDYTASIVGAALGVEVIEIWTDVAGVYTADPRKVKEAFPVPEMSYLEAIEMSYFGAKVIHPPTMYPAMEKKIPIIIKNTFAPQEPGTRIGGKKSAQGVVKGISSIGNVVMLQVSGSGMQGTKGASGRLFAALARAKVNVVLIAQASSQNSISFAIAPGDVDKACAEIEEEFRLERANGLINDIEVTRDLAIIAVVGEGMKGVPGVAGRIFETLAKNHTNAVAIAQGSSEINISCVVPKADETRALQAVHTACFFPEVKPINLFLIGAGNIGGELLRQIQTQQSVLAYEQGFRIRVVAVADIEHMVFDEQGIDLTSWNEVLHAGEKMHLREFVVRMKEIDLPGKAFVDCTASQEVADTYAEILGSWISVVASNKHANSGPYAYYKQLGELARRPGVSFLYEPNGCAALPIISMIDDIVLSGDHITKIEGVFSGTLSHVFTEVAKGRAFSEVMREANEQGYTEPDPRDDLSSMDVARKLVIIARKSGYEVEMEDVEIERLIGQKYFKAKSVDAFLDMLKEEDERFEKLRVEAAAEGKRLRHVGQMEHGKLSIKLVKVGPEHPFYDLTSTDNVVAITTDRYAKTPLVIRGPGAGTSVCAACVFADVLRAARDMA